MNTTGGPLCAIITNTALNNKQYFFFSNTILDLSKLNKMYKERTNLKYINSINTMDNNPNNAEEEVQEVRITWIPSCVYAY